MKLKLILILVCYLHSQISWDVKILHYRIWLGWHGNVYPQPFSTVQCLVACASQHSRPLPTQGLTVQCLVACVYLKWSKTGRREGLGTRLDDKLSMGLSAELKIEAKRTFVQTSISCLHSTFIHLPSPLTCSIEMCVLVLERFRYDNFVYITIVCGFV